MAMWMRGGGGESANLGVEFDTASAIPTAPPPTPAASVKCDAECGARPALGWGVTLKGAREIELSFAGGCNARLISCGSEDWLSELRPTREIVLTTGGARETFEGGENIFVHVLREHITRAAELIRAAFEADPSTRMAVLYEPEDEMAWLRAMGDRMRASLVMDLGGAKSVGGATTEALLKGSSHARVLAFGQRRWRGKYAGIDRAAVAELMDPMDSGKTAPVAKLKLGRARCPTHPTHP